MSTYRDVLPFACQGCKFVIKTMLNGSRTHYDRILYACSIDKMEEIKTPYKTSTGVAPSECLHKALEAQAADEN